jgi:cytochrome c553
MWCREISLPRCFPAKGGLVSHASQAARLRTGARWLGTLLVLLAITLYAVGKGFFRAEREFRSLRSHSLRTWPGREKPWTIISRGDAFRGLLLARRCNHCHGEEGFSSVPSFPNLAGEDRLSFWKQMQDFRSGKRTSPVMQSIAEGFSGARRGRFGGLLRDAADGERSARQPSVSAGHADPSRASMAIRLIVFGDGQRGIPPCQSCHGPVSYVNGAPPLATQNGDYLEQQLEHFSNGQSGQRY